MKESKELKKLKENKEIIGCLKEFHIQLKDVFLEWCCPAGQVNFFQSDSECLNKLRYLKSWIKTVKKFPGLLLNESHSACELGITKESFRSIKNKEEIENCKCSWTKGTYYYAFLLNELQDILVGSDKNSKCSNSILEYNKKVANSLGVKPANCFVCGQPKVISVCETCGEFCCYFHAERINDFLHPFIFSESTVCWKCIFKSPFKTYPIVIDGNNRMKENLENYYDYKWFIKEDVHKSWWGINNTNN